ncbi:UGPA uridylyltransferase, partial [Polypterus senegalus]
MPFFGPPPHLLCASSFRLPTPASNEGRRPLLSSSQMSPRCSRHSFLWPRPSVGGSAGCPPGSSPDAVLNLPPSTSWCGGSAGVTGPQGIGAPPGGDHGPLQGGASMPCTRGPQSNQEGGPHVIQGLGKAGGMSQFQEVIRQELENSMKNELEKLQATASEVDLGVVKKDFVGFKQLFHRFLQEKGPSVDWVKIKRPPEDSDDDNELNSSGCFSNVDEQ